MRAVVISDHSILYLQYVLYCILYNSSIYCRNIHVGIYRCTVCMNITVHGRSDEVKMAPTILLNHEPTFKPLGKKKEITFKPFGTKTKYYTPSRNE